MSKPKLIITMGCSYTEGVGCYDPNTLLKDSNGEYLNFLKHGDKLLENKTYLKNKDRFHQYGWPSVLQKLLNYDELINLGLGGGSTSGNLKVYFEKYSHLNLSDNYDVLFVWLLPQASRFSFYRNGHVVNIIPSMNRNLYNKYTYNLGLEYVKFLGNIDYDPMLEQLFYVKIMEDHCKLKNYNFLFGLTDNSSENLYKNMYFSESLMLDGKNCIVDVNKYKDLKSLICDHPNEMGYEFMAKSFFDWIKQHKPELISKIKPENFKSKWDGDGLSNHNLNPKII